MKTKLITKTKAPAWYVAHDVMKQQGLTYEKLGKMIGMSTTSTFQIVNYAPSILHVKMMADAMHVPFRKFFDFNRTAKTANA